MSSPGSINHQNRTFHSTFGLVWLGPIRWPISLLVTPLQPYDTPSFLASCELKVSIIKFTPSPGRLGSTVKGQKPVDMIYASTAVIRANRSRLVESISWTHGKNQGEERERGEHREMIYFVPVQIVRAVSWSTPSARPDGGGQGD